MSGELIAGIDAIGLRRNDSTQKRVRTDAVESAEVLHLADGAERRDTLGGEATSTE